MPNIPAGAKTPDDRQAKDIKPKVEKVNIELPDGLDENDEPKTRTVPARRVIVGEIEATVPDEALDDFELLDDIRAASDEQDASRLPSLLRRLVGDDYKRILGQLRDPISGRVKASDGTKFVWDLFGALNPNS